MMKINFNIFRGGKFLSRRHLEIPGSSRVDGRGPEYYSLADLFIGAKLEVFGRQFVISGCDETVRKYLDESGVHLPAGKYSLLIGLNKAILVSDWLTHNNTII